LAGGLIKEEEEEEKYSFLQKYSFRQKISWRFTLRVNKGLYSETGFYYGKEHNFVCSWRRPNCRSHVIDLSLSALMKSVIEFSINFNLYAIISTSLIINLH
jgi:hypothetical protein